MVKDIFTLEITAVTCYTSRRGKLPQVFKLWVFRWAHDAIMNAVEGENILWIH